jgi:two-component system LytT family response regulator
MKTANRILISPKRSISPEEVVLLVAEVNYTKVYFSNGRKTILPITLKTLEEQFNERGFFRTHKSYLVNLLYFKEVNWNKANPFILLSNDFRASISRRKRTSLRMKLSGLQCS